MLRFPYGVSDFHKIRTDQLLYLDRTHLIPELEQAGYQLVFLRPRRFGKSLLLSTLAHYYDLNKADEFSTLFAGLAVGHHPTPEKNRYLILRWDFSKVSGQGDIEQIKQNLFDHINNSIQAFGEYYRSCLKQVPAIDAHNALSSLEQLLSMVQRSGQQIYLLIDEYDNFANEVLMHGQADEQRYRDLLEGEGIVKSLFKTIKGSASEGKIARVFITGVSPLVLSDVTSGYNVATSIFLEPRFNALCGITHEELGGLVAATLKACGHQDQQDSVLETLRQFYNGYRFCTKLEQPLIYNPTLCLYFLRHYQRECEAPRQMLDGNLATDAGRIRYIARLPEGNKVIERIMDEQRPLTLPYLEAQFGVEHLQRLQNESSFIVSLMYFFGILTIRGVAGLGNLVMGVPNLVIQALYVEQLQHHALPRPQERELPYQLAEAFYQSADLEPLANYMESKYFAVFSNRDYRWSNELTVKTAFLTLLFNDIWYVMDSETTLKRRYSDLVMLIRPSMRQYDTLKDIVLEFKYVGLKTLKLSTEQARTQPRENLAELPLIKAALDEAETQLLEYKQVLTEKLQQPDRLRALAVVALGFERVVWRMV